MADACAFAISARPAMSPRSKVVESPTILTCPGDFRSSTSLGRTGRATTCQGCLTRTQAVALGSPRPPCSIRSQPWPSCRSSNAMWCCGAIYPLAHSLPQRRALGLVASSPVHPRTSLLKDCLSRHIDTATHTRGPAIRQRDCI